MSISHSTEKHCLDAVILQSYQVDLLPRFNRWKRQDTYRTATENAVEVVRKMNVMVRRAEVIIGDLKGGKRMPKAGGAKTTGFTFDAVDAAEAASLVKKGIMWDGRTRKVAIFEQGRAVQEASRKIVAPIGARGWQPSKEGKPARATRAGKSGLLEPGKPELYKSGKPSQPRLPVWRNAGRGTEDDERSAVSQLWRLGPCQAGMHIN
ncbi:hypothetical protein EV426DRAFT_700969 [Tirmania nivea]|nr:hypothetical protein EV426DRAFT_700969 [Tirmania nivea]